MRNILITGPVRTPIGAFCGGLSSLSPGELGEIVARESLKRTGLQPDQIDEVIFGHVIQAGHGMNVARQILLKTGIPKSVTGFTVNMVCGSGLKALEQAWQSIQLHRSNIVLAGGVENMTQSPYLLPAMRQGARLGETKAVDSMIRDGLSDPLGDYHMGITAENVARNFSIPRAAQDEFAADSQRKWSEANQAGRFKEEIIPVTIHTKKGAVVIDTDEHPRPDTSPDKLAKLKPAFLQDGGVTAGNSSGINDGAASLILIADDCEEAKSVDRSKAVYLREAAACGCEPEMMGLGPIGAVKILMERSGLSIDQIDLWEINEAFASQSLAVISELNLDKEKVNVNGGAIALGHPIGASGARIVVTLTHEMKRRNARYGVATLCIGGGMGMAVLLENA